MSNHPDHEQVVWVIWDCGHSSNVSFYVGISFVIILEGNIIEVSINSIVTSSSSELESKVFNWGVMGYLWDSYGLVTISSHEGGIYLS